jgi:beta-glucosidase
MKQFKNILPPSASGLACITLAVLLSGPGLAAPVSAADSVVARPWMNTALTADARALLLEQAMTLDERLALLHSPMAIELGPFHRPYGALGSAGYVAGVARLGIPALNQTDASLGVTNPFQIRVGDTATALPSGLALAATWNPQRARVSGAAIGKEAHAKGFNVLLAGGVNLTRDPRGGRNFEYLGEDPWLAGVMAGASIAGIQSEHVISTAKHFALNAYETGRNFHNGKIDPAALRESDLLAFELAIERGQPGSIMCAYNKVNGAYACENEALLVDTLKRDWGYKGWVMSDWGAVHSTASAAKGLDHQSGEQLDKQVYFGESLKQAVTAGEVTSERVSDMVRRILRSMFAIGLFDQPPRPAPVDYDFHANLARQIGAEGIVLLRNERGLLPLGSDIKRIAVIGGNASLGVLSGGGSAQVTPSGKPTISVQLGADTEMDNGTRRAVWFPSAPLDAIRKRAPKAEVIFDDGRYPTAAANLARTADVAIVFATQWNSENEDVPDLTLPQGQDAVVAAVAAANPRTVVVLETGGPVEMPWLDATAAVLEAWYPGQHGGEAITDVLFGDVNPSGRLPITFPKTVAQLPRPTMPGVGLAKESSFDIDYVEGADVGYRWFAKTGAAPLFPFGHGLSYSEFAVTGLRVQGGKTLTISFDVANTGKRAGADVPQVYLSSAAGTPTQRLIGWEKVHLAPGEHKRVSIEADPRLLGRFDAQANKWKIAAGDYRVTVGASATAPALQGTAKLVAQELRP